MASPLRQTAIERRIKPKFQSKNHEIVAGIIEASGAALPIDPYVKVKRLTAETAVTMALIHGGDFRVEVDHEAGMILVCRRSSGRSVFGQR